MVTSIDKSALVTEGGAQELINKTVSNSTVAGTFMSTSFLQPRTLFGTSNSNPVPNIDSYDVYRLAAQGATASFGAPIGTPYTGQKLLVIITGTATRDINWSSGTGGYASSGMATLLTITSGTNTHYVGLIYNGQSDKWLCVAVDPAGF